MTILTTTTRLTNEFTFRFNSFTNSFAISYLRFTYVTFYFEFTVHTVNDDIQVKFAHTGDNSLTCFFISTNFESRIFFCQTSKSCTHFFLVSFCFRFNSNGDNWFREFHGFKNYRILFITKSITSSSIFQAYSCSDVASVNHVDFFTSVSVHLKNTADTFFLTFCGVENVGTGFQCTGVHTEER